MFNTSKVIKATRTKHKFWNRRQDILIELICLRIFWVVRGFLILLQLKRYNTYVYLLKAHMAAYPELEPSLVETVITEVDDSGELDKRGSPAHRGGAQRSLSERYSYRAAIYNTEQVEYDI